MQYLELGFNFYENYIPYAAILLFITVASGFFATFRLHEKQMILYNSVRRRQVVPLVMFGFVRYNSWLLIKLTPKGVVFSFLFLFIS